MCGIAGYITNKTTNQEQQITAMINTLAHRGPDNQSHSIHQTTKQQIVLGHARLSILDVSSAANQPMEFDSLNMVFNGEIYNFKAIKTQLEQKGHHFNTNSDTEVILHAFKQWGVDCVNQFRGMFAIVIHDQSCNKVYCIRDRAGVKPFYYTAENSTFIFGSEIKAILAHQDFTPTISPSSAAQFFQYGYIHSPNSIYQNVNKLKPGHFLVIDLNDLDIQEKQYWNVLDYYNKPTKKLDYEQAVTELEEILIESTKLRMVSDVPIGVFLSGGYDSSLVTALLSHHTNQTIKTFTIGFENKEFNEAHHAKEVAKILGTEHHEFVCTEQEAKDFVPKIGYYYDEPFADVSTIPSMLLSKKTAEHVTVALSADAGDEIFAGYDKHKRALQYLNKLSKYNNQLASPTIIKLFNSFVPNQKQRLKHNLAGIASMYQQNQFSSLGLMNLISQKQNKTIVNQLLNSHFKYHQSWLDATPESIHLNNQPLNQMLAIDYLTYMSDNILTKVDRATMSASLEGREPLLDQHIIEYAANLPQDFKYDGNHQKKILRTITHKYLPESLMNRPKQGFTLPIFDWLQKDLKDFAAHYLSESVINKVGIYNTKYTDLVRKEFFKQNRDFYDMAWYLIIFNQWHEQWNK